MKTKNNNVTILMRVKAFAKESNIKSNEKNARSIEELISKTMPKEINFNGEVLSLKVCTHKIIEENSHSDDASDI